MAQIKMDVSEYEAMKENKRLLEDSLKNERKLKEQVDKLQKEKIEALENAKMKVVTINKTIVEERLLRKRLDGRNIDRLRYELEYDKILGYAGINMDRLSDIFFEKTTIIDENNVETYTTGLDKVKVKLRKEIEESISNEQKYKLEQADKAMKSYSELVERIDELESTLADEQKSNEALTNTCSDLQKTVDISNVNAMKVKAIQNVINGGWGLFDKGEKLEKINKFLKHEDSWYLNQ